MNLFFYVHCTGGIDNIKFAHDIHGKISVDIDTDWETRCPCMKAADTHVGH